MSSAKEETSKKVSNSSQDFFIATLKQNQTETIVSNSSQ
jgi:hypothetical protein